MFAFKISLVAHPFYSWLRFEGHVLGRSPCTTDHHRNVCSRSSSVSALALAQLPHSLSNRRDNWTRLGLDSWFWGFNPTLAAQY
jgi:hypothetical protein